MTMRMGEELALDLALDGRIDAASPETSRLVALAESLEALPDPEIDPAFAARLEAMLLAEPVEEAQPARTLRVVHPAPAPQPAAAPEDILPVRPAAIIPLPRRRMVVRRSAVAAVAAAALMAFPVAAGASALPGSPVYGVKRLAENIELWTARGPVAKGFEHLERSQSRLTEVQQLLARGASAATVARTATEAKTELAAGSTLIIANAGSEDLDRLGREASAIADGIAGLVAQAPAPARPALEAALRLGRSIQAQVAGTTATTVAPAVDAIPAAPTAAIPAGTANTETATVTDTSTRTGDDTTAKDPSDDPGKKRRNGDGDDATGTVCSIPGSANGLGDTLAPIARLTCH